MAGLFHNALMTQIYSVRVVKNCAHNWQVLTRVGRMKWLNLNKIRKREARFMSTTIARNTLQCHQKFPNELGFFFLFNILML